MNDMEWQPEAFLFRVTDLKQYVYCPRILYYHTILPQVRPTTFKMEAGIELHREEEAREQRRGLRSYGLAAGERYFNVALQSAALGLSGEIDLLIETETEYIPVDYKTAARVGEHYELQLMAYGRLVELAWPGATKPVRRGFLYLTGKRKAVEVKFSSRLRAQLEAAMAELYDIARGERMPGPTKQRRRCVDCEFRRFCNDVL